MQEDNKQEDQLNLVLDLHMRWLRGEVGGQRADLRGADLQRADVQRVRVFLVGPIGSRGDFTVFRHGQNPDGSVLDEVMTGCFTGTLAEFEAAVSNTHNSNKYAAAYTAVIGLVRNMWGI